MEPLFRGRLVLPDRVIFGRLHHMRSPAGGSGKNATNSLAIMPGPAFDALCEAMLATRPWTDEEATARRLRAWAETYLKTGSLNPGDADGAAEVAAELHVLAQREELDDGSAVGATFFMVHNVSLGRPAGREDRVKDTFHGDGIPARSMRQYRSQPDGWDRVKRRIQRELDIAGLMRGGRSEAAARRWLQRNPDKHARDAPAARQRAG